MYTTVLPPIDQYRHVGTVTAVTQANPHQLVMLLFDGAIAAVLQARHALGTGDMDTKRSTISKAMRIIDEGLRPRCRPTATPRSAPTWARSTSTCCRGCSWPT